MGTEKKTLDTGTVEVWLLRFSELRNVAKDPACFLSGEERQRMAALEGETAQARFALGRATLRALLARYLEEPAQYIRIESGRWGKPQLNGRASGLQFNVSHSEDALAIAFSNGRRVGIDIEKTDKPITELLKACSLFSGAQLKRIEGFIRLAPLVRTAADLSKFAVPKRLPLLQDLLDRMYMVGSADYFVYTNSDIALHEDFYVRVSELAAEGRGAFVINRRTVKATPEQARDLNWLQSQEGEPHPGMDCFVFNRQVLDELRLWNVCVGMPGYSGMFGAVLSMHGENFEVFEDLKLTFHVNDSRTWDDPRFADYKLHNLEESLKTAIVLKMSHPGTPLLQSMIKIYQGELRSLRDQLAGMNRVFSG